MKIRVSAVRATVENMQFRRRLHVTGVFDRAMVVRWRTGERDDKSLLTIVASRLLSRRPPRNRRRFDSRQTARDTDVVRAVGVRGTCPARTVFIMGRAREVSSIGSSRTAARECLRPPDDNQDRSRIVF